MITACLLGHLLRTRVVRAPAAAHLPLPVTGNRPLSHHLVSLGRCTAPPIVYTRPQRKEFNFLYHMGPEGVRNRKKHPSFLLMPNSHKLRKDSKNVNFKIGPLGPKKLSQIFNMPIIKSVARKGQNTPKSDFRGPKIPPRGASST